MRTWSVDKKRQQATQAPSKMDEKLKHIVSIACRPGVFQIALFKGFPNIPHIPYLQDTQQTQMREQWHRPLKTHRIGTDVTVPEKHGYTTPAVLAVLGFPR